jgi:hypothetical protein
MILPQRIDCPFPTRPLTGQVAFLDVLEPRILPQENLFADEGVDVKETAISLAEVNNFECTKVEGIATKTVLATSERSKRREVALSLVTNLEKMYSNQ